MQPIISSVADLVAGTPSTRDNHISWRTNRPNWTRDRHLNILDQVGAADDPSVGQSAQINLAITDAYAAGGGIVQLFNHGIDGVVSVPANVNLQGVGDGDVASGSILKCSTSNAQIAFGARGTSSYGGMNGHFLIDGNHVANAPFYLGRTLGRQFHNVFVTGAVQTACLIEEAQNNTFVASKFIKNDGDGIVFDRGAAGNNFYATEGAANGQVAGSHVVFQATAATISGLLNYPINNRFFGGIFEQAGAGLIATVNSKAGRLNRFSDLQLDCTLALPIVKMADAGFSPGNQNLFFRDVDLQGGTVATAFDLDNAATIYVSGMLTIQNVANGFRLRDASSNVNYYGGAPFYSSVTNVMHASSVGTVDKIVTDSHSRVSQTITSTTAQQLTNDAGTRYLLVNTSTGPTYKVLGGMDVLIYSDAGSTLKVNIDGATGNLLTAGHIGVGNSAAATTPGAVTKKIEVFDASGASLGYIAVYGSIA